MLTSETFTNCLEHLFPCAGLIYVGAGNGAALNGERYSRISRLLAIEADDLAFSYLASNLQNRTGWTALKALIGEDEAETSFFAASNPNESGLLNPEALKAVWRNLTCQEVRPQVSTSLSSVLQNECEAEHYNWLSVDCLPSARILQGLERHLEQFDVIDVRVLDRAAGILEEGCTKAECDTLLTSLGYQMVFVEEATNPMVQRVLYVRDGRASLEIHTERLNQRYQVENEQLSQAKAAAEKLATERAQQTEQASKAKDEQAKLAQERQAQIEQLTQAKAVAEKAAGERAQQLEEATKAKDEQARLAGERLKQIEQLTQAKAAAEKTAGERLQKMNELLLEIQNRKVSEAELVSRQKLMHDEMVRAEAQLELIKDILLRELTL